MAQPLPLKRVLLKLSGESLTGSDHQSISQDACERVARLIFDLHQAGVQVAIVIGGGNIFRGIQSSALNLPRTPADHMGMLATLINAIALKETLLLMGCSTRIMSAIECSKVAEPFIWREAVKALDEKNILIFAGGTGNAYFTTDTAAALRASEIKADLLIKATKVDGVYDKDPGQHPDAKRYSTISYSQVLAERLKIMDMTAIALCMDNEIPIFVFNMFDKYSITDLLSSYDHGTLVKN